jgi:hypothetical protein
MRTYWDWYNTSITLYFIKALLQGFLSLPSDTLYLAHLIALGIHTYINNCLIKI